MGCCASSEGDAEGRSRNAAIDIELQKERERNRNQVKMLLLGAGESGKSTVLKQMKLIHDNGMFIALFSGTPSLTAILKGYSPDEREAFKEIIFSNTVQSMRVILEAMDTMGIALGSPENGYHRAVIQESPMQIEATSLPREIAEAVKALWRDEGVRWCFGRSREFQLNDSAPYYFDSIDRIARRDYLPSDQDVLRSRVKTTGIIETTFHIGDLVYRLYDVGGQRSERKKWIHCFENVTSIIFLVAISEYDQVLVEDETVNRMQEALTLFDSICNSRWFVKTSIILFLNKIDLFRQKLQTSPMSKYFHDYHGGNDYDSATNYILNRFVSLNHSDQKQIYAHFTCATDTSQIKFVMAAVNDIIIQANLRDCGLIGTASGRMSKERSIDRMSKIIIIAGYGVGISNGVARKFGKLGYEPALIARTASKLDAAVKALATEGIKAHAFPTDLFDLDALRRTVSSIQNLGAVHIIHWNSAWASPSSVLKGELSDIVKDFTGTTLGLIATVRQTIESLKANKGAVLVTGGSLANDTDEATKLALQYNLAGHVITKNSQRKLARTMHFELEPLGVYACELTVDAFVKGTAADVMQTAKLTPVMIADRFYKMFTERKVSIDMIDDKDL
ncbi:guanine nucleotide-binding protein subunit alpha [Irineochytrium annulatum]|nr:guanine nucleotide-binding protein subunit alpha [Irineochytrium annulatum]